jgi:lipooligosaccharide transport system permease protein
MLATPLDVDIVLGEMTWAATKSLVSAGPILVVAAALGLVGGWSAMWVLPATLLVGLAFAAMGLVVTALSKSYDFFIYYFTLVVTPMMLFSGVFFPLATLPWPIRAAAYALPLAHAIDLIRPLMAGRPVPAAPVHVAVLVVYAAGGFTAAVALARRRLLR